MTSRRWVAVTATVAAVALVLSGCFAPPQPDDDEPVVPDTADVGYNAQPRDALEQGGIARFALSGIPEQLNPFASDTTPDAARLWSWTNPQLLLTRPDGTTYKNDAYLDSWSIDSVDGNTQLTFTFTDEAHWNDGADMDWTAIAATWVANRASTDGFLPQSSTGYDQIRAVEKGESAKTAIVTFSGEYAWPESLFSFIVHPAVNSAELFNDGYRADPHPDWGAGPYRVDVFDPANQFVSLTPNPEWWGNAPLLDQVTFTAMTNDAALTAFLNDEIDLAPLDDQDALTQATEHPGAETYVTEATSRTVLQLNAAAPALASVDVRHALLMSIDTAAQRSAIWDGFGTEEEPLGAITLLPGQRGYADALGQSVLGYDPDAANEILDAAGWAPGDDGIRQLDGVRLSLTFPVYSPSAPELARADALAASARGVGIEIVVDVRDASLATADLAARTWDIAAVTIPVPDAYEVARFCDVWCSTGRFNLTGTGTADTDQLITDRVTSQPSAADQLTAAMDLESQLFTDAWGFLPLYVGPSAYAAREGLANLTPEPFDGLDAFGVRAVEDVGWMR